MNWAGPIDGQWLARSGADTSRVWTVEVVDDRFALYRFNYGGVMPSTPRYVGGFETLIEAKVAAEAAELEMVKASEREG